MEKGGNREMKIEKINYNIKSIIRGHQKIKINKEDFKINIEINKEKRKIV